MDSLFGIDWHEMRDMAETMWDNGGAKYIIMAAVAMVVTAYFTLRREPR